MTGTVHLDFEQLRVLSGDDDDFVIEILEMIIEQSPAVLQDMTAQLQRADYPSLGATAHKYKSSVNILGSPVINSLVKDIELTAFNQGNKDQLPDLISQFHQVCDEMLALVRSELQALKTA
ncbi:MAG: Hpt domain-containing protein [Bacteroidia bacterium]|jgi:HPt (histidine-containing phosphotransfer) domain-containing protein|nr:Hpt domain-containing protein [Bacteroidia bacterium]